MLIVNDAAAEVRRVLSTDFARLVVAIVSMALGASSILVQWLRHKTQDRLRLWFGLLALLYGYRALLMTDSAGFFLSRSNINFQIGLVTFTIGMPAILFGWGMVAQKQNRVTKTLLVVNALLALTYLLLHSNGAAVRVLYTVNNVLVITFTLAMLIYLFTVAPDSIPDLRTLRIILLVWGIFVIYNNLRSWLPVANEDFEFIGFALFLCSLGYLVAGRSVRTEEALAAIRKELEIARQIQTSILPEAMPNLRGIAVAARYLPMSDVAGDFYEFLLMDDRRVGVLIADVSGHGVPAALVASMVKVAIASQAEHADDPAKVLAGMNSILSGKLQGQFVTAAYLFLNLETGTGLYSAAGHPPLMHYVAAEGAVNEVLENGLILGVMPFAKYETKGLRLGPGDRFLLYTDGVLEAERDGEEFGMERVKQIVARCTSADQLCDCVSSEVKAWTGGAAGDDVTVLAVTVG